MEDIKFKCLRDRNDFFNTSGVKYLGSGWEGSCYKKGNRTYKLYNSTYINLINSDDESFDRLLRYNKLFIDNIYFIRALVYCENFIVGSICDYASGKPCASIDLYNTNIDNIIQALKTLKNNIFELSELAIFIEDEFLYNILFNGKNFKLIDTGRYYQVGDALDEDQDIDDLGDVYELNMKRMMKILFEAITLNKYNCNNLINKYLVERKSCYKNFLLDRDLLLEPDSTMSGIKTLIQEDIGREIITFKDCERELLKLKKR